MIGGRQLVLEAINHRNVVMPIPCSSAELCRNVGHISLHSTILLRLILETLCAYTGALHDSSATSGNEGPSEQAWADAFAQALLALQKYSRAQKGDRTMLDALIPAQQAFSDAAHSGVSLLHLATRHQSMHA